MFSDRMADPADYLPDRTTRDVARQVRETAYDAHTAPVGEAEWLLRIYELCGCSHERGAHHAADGSGACGETGCECVGWHPAQVECPDCGATWPDNTACPGCGLTIEDVAARLARQAEADRRKEWTR